MITFRTTSVYSIPSKLSVVELIDVSRFDILNLHISELKF